MNTEHEAADSENRSKPAGIVKKEFAARLNRLMIERGWNQSEVARQAALHMPDGKFGRDSVSGYVRARSLPGPIHLEALSKAFKVPPDELLPSRGMPSGSDHVPPLDVRDTGKGKAWLRVNQVVEWEKALKILAILKEDDERPENK